MKCTLSVSFVVHYVMGKGSESFLHHFLVQKHMLQGHLRLLWNRLWVSFSFTSQVPPHVTLLARCMCLARDHLRFSMSDPCQGMAGSWASSEYALLLVPSLPRGQCVVSSRFSLDHLLHLTLCVLNPNSFKLCVLPSKDSERPPPHIG